VRPPVRRAPEAGARPAIRRPGLGYAREIYSELKKVTWPTFQQARDLTFVVVAVSLAVGVILGGIDFIFAKFIEVFLLNPL